MELDRAILPGVTFPLPLLHVHHVWSWISSDLIPAAAAVPIPGWVLAGNRWQISRGKLRRVWWMKCSQDDYRLRKPRKGLSLVVQWLRICLPMWGTRVRSLVREDPTCHWATKPVHQNYSRPPSKVGKPHLLSPPATTNQAHPPWSSCSTREVTAAWRPHAAARG